MSIVSVVGGGKKLAPPLGGGHAAIGGGEVPLFDVTGCSSKGRI